MLHKLKIILLFLITLIFTTGLSSMEVEAKRKPKWVSEKPVNNEYYIGVGKSEKSNKNYLQTAKNNALADMISEISVTISTNSVLSQLEDHTGYKETYQAQIKLSAKDYIEEYELVDTWENKEEYWIYYRLSKAQYESKKRAILNHAKDLSKDFYEKAKEAEKVYNIHNALQYYVKAFEAIQEHVGEDLSVFTFEGRIHLDNAIYQSIQDIFSRMRIIPGEELFTVKALSKDNDPVYVKVKLKTELETQNISNVPILFSFPELDIKKTENVITSTRGIAECTMANMAPKGSTQTINAQLNTNVYFGDNETGKLLKSLFTEKGNIPYGQIDIEVKELFAYLESQEFMLGSLNSENPVTALFKEKLSKHFFSFTEDKEKADVIIKINSEIKEGTKIDKYNLYEAFLSANISVTKIHNHTEVYNESTTQIKGMKSGSYKKAARDAIEKAEKEIENRIIPGIQKINL